MKVETYKYLSECLDYSPAQGSLMWKERPLKHFSCSRIYNVINSRNAWRPAGSFGLNGYWTVRVSGQLLLSHRVAWILGNKKNIPKGMQIDHIDQNKTNNKITNLRLATKAQNGWNSKKQDRSSHKNITLDRRNGTYQVCVKANGKKYRKQAKTLEEAKRVAVLLREEAHGEFACHG